LLFDRFFFDVICWKKKKGKYKEMKSGQMLKIFLAKKTISFLKESLNNSCKASKKISNYLKCSILFQQFTNNIEIKVLPVVNFIKQFCFVTFCQKDFGKKALAKC